MKKLTFISLLLFVLSIAAWSQKAERVSQERALQVAQSFADAKLNARGEALTLVKADNIYVYNIGDHGFVMVSGNTVLPPVLGYSLNETFPSMEGAPENYVSWINHYGEMIDFAMEKGIQPEAMVLQQWDDAQEGLFPARSTTSVAPLLETTWNQDYPYNYYAPESSGSWWGGPGGHCYAGCVACAMAQVMKYWNYPATGRGSHSYVHSTYGQQSANFGETTYQWDIMPNELGYQANDAARAVALLMYHCGVSVNMNFGPDGSAAYSKDVETALRSYFGYCGAKYLEKSKYEQAQWIAMLKAELDQSHPVYYSGSSESSGHAFVFDGYDNNDYFHINLGWSGSGNDYYSLADVAGYHGNQAAVMNIVPLDIHADSNGIIYVRDDGDGDGSSWANATNKLEYAAFLSTDNTTRVWVKSGTYFGDENDIFNAFTIAPSSMVFGGFNGDEDPDFNIADRDLANHPTILDGGGTRRVLNQPDILTAGTQALWDGFIIQNGNSGSGAGVYLNNYSTLSNCIIRNNVSNGIGGGVYINAGGTGIKQNHLNNCVITGNTASLGGGLCDRNNSIITNCMISGNTATTKGGGVYIYNTDQPTFRGCIISNNTAKEGGGIYARGKCTMTNCDIVMNQALESYGGVFNEHAYLHSTYTSCIIWGNEAGSYPNLYQYNGKFEYCAVQGGIEGTGNINLPAENDGEEPGVYVRFSQPAEGTGVEYTDADWSIQSRSICLNAGKPGSPGFSFDIAGDARVQHERVDIGAFERNASLTLIEGHLNDAGIYNYHGTILNEPGYYTFVHPTPTCDSVVGLTLMMPVGLDEINSNAEILSVDVFSLLGQHLGRAKNLEAVKELYLKKGCYLLMINTSEGSMSKKIVLK